MSERREGIEQPTPSAGLTGHSSKGHSKGRRSNSSVFLTFIAGCGEFLLSCSFFVSPLQSLPWKVHAQVVQRQSWAG